MYKTTPIVVHVPHASVHIPKRDMRYFVKEETEGEILKMTDHFCDELFSCSHRMIRFPVSRLVCDVERFRDNDLEVMYRKGMGFAYTKGSSLQHLRDVDEGYENILLKEYYDPHHRRFEEAVEERLKEHNKCLILDGHSFPARPLPYEDRQDVIRPDICIGADDYHTPRSLVNMMIRYFEDLGYSVKVNDPFAGSIVPLKYYMKDRRVISVMVEINRGLYVDETGKKTKGYARVRNDMYRLTENMLEYIYIRR